MIEINGVKWYTPTEKTPGTKDCGIVLINTKTEFSDNGYMNSVTYTEWNGKNQGVFCTDDNTEYKTEILKYACWCYAKDFFKQFEKVGFKAEKLW
jgi:hypothetical protein